MQTMHRRGLQALETNWWVQHLAAIPQDVVETKNRAKRVDSHAAVTCASVHRHIYHQTCSLLTCTQVKPEKVEHRSRISLRHLLIGRLVVWSPAAAVDVPKYPSTTLKRLSCDISLKAVFFLPWHLLKFSLISATYCYSEGCSYGSKC